MIIIDGLNPNNYIELTFDNRKTLMSKLKLRNSEIRACTEGAAAPDPKMKGGRETPILF